jgi:hypothetical protein
LLRLIEIYDELEQMNKANRDKLKALEMEQLKIKYPSMRESSWH